MIKRTLQLSLAFLVVLSVFLYGFYGNDIPNTIGDGSSYEPNPADTGITCSGGVIRDDNTYENGYAIFQDSSSFVHKLRPASFPYSINAVCVAWTRTAAGPATWTYDLVIYDTTGPGGTPGTLLALIPGVQATNIAIYPQHSRYRHSLANAVNVTGAVYVGVRMDNNPSTAIYISVDENGTANGSGYGRNVSTYPPVWSAITTLPNFSLWKNFGIRIEGSSGPPPPSGCNLLATQFAPISAYPSMPAATYFNSAAWIGDTMYVQTPTTAGAGQTNVYRYKYGVGWTTGVPCLVGVTGASLTAANGKLYLIGGGTTTITAGTTNVQEYNPATGVWTAKAPLPVPLSAHGAVNWGDSVIFIVGGPYTGAATNLNVHYYRIASNTWGTITNSLPSGQGRRTFALGLTMGNKIVMSCGFNTAYLKSTYVGTIGANASLLTWAAAPDAPVALSRPGGTGYGNYFYLIGGDTNGTAVKNDKLFMFNSATNAWFLTIPSNPNPVSNMMNAITTKCVNDTVKLFQAGGYTTVATNPLIALGGTTIVSNGNINTGTPVAYSLSQNYPNPFNPSTKITFMMPNTGKVSLVIYDILGREVASLVNEVKQAGIHTIDFNASHLSSGVYLYTLRTGNFTDTKRMLLVK